MILLVGYTGFVGSNLVDSFGFDGLYNSKNIEEAFGTNPDLLVYSGVRAEMFLANKDPEADLAIIKNAMMNIEKINPKKVVLISTIAVYKNAKDVDEDFPIILEGLSPYGVNRYLLEKWVEDNYANHLIIRLPAIYGNNIKKNFIYDFMKFIPSLLTEAKYRELCERDESIKDYYFLETNGFYKCKMLNEKETVYLKGYFEKNKFSALNFTDSRAKYQFYNLKYLWEHISLALDAEIKKMNIATEPVAVGELYGYLTGKTFINELNKEVIDYDFKSKYAQIFSGNNGYIYNKNTVLEDIKKYVESYNI